jgi:2,4-dichlorophenol 6-monooxygenase
VRPRVALGDIFCALADDGDELDFPVDVTAAAAAISAQLGIDLPVILIGPGQPYEDPYGTWAELREIADDGAILTRPDLYVAYRVTSAPASADEATTQLASALGNVFGR